VHVIKRAGFILAVIFLTSCAYFAEIEIFEEQNPVRVLYKPGTVNQSLQLDLNQPSPIKVALLPVRSNLGGGLGEDNVTKNFYKNLLKELQNITFISTEEASDMFVDKDLWEDYFAYLVKYTRHSITDFDEVKRLYTQLEANYIININSDYSLIPRYPTNVTVSIQVQMWDVNSGKLVWEGFGQGDCVIPSEEYTDKLKDKMADLVCQRLVKEMKTIRQVKQTTPIPAVN
jgi:hypothetical protein